MVEERLGIYHGDCLKILPTLTGIDAVVTDPPYGLGFMGKEWDNFNPKKIDEAMAKDKRPHTKIASQRRSNTAGTYDLSLIGKRKYEDWCYSWAKLLLDACKPGAHLLCFGGTRTFHRIACAIEDEGWEIRDTLGWIYGQGFPKSFNVGKKLAGWEGWGTALKPAWEPIILARKPLEGTVAENVLKYGTGGLNIDGCRIPLDGTENLNAVQNGNIYGAGEIYGKAIQHHTTPTYKPQGRFPANLIHDGSQEVMELFPNVKSGGKVCKTDCGNSIFGKRNVNTIMNTGDSGSAARFFYCAKASRAERDAGLEDMPEVTKGSNFGNDGARPHTKADYKYEGKIRNNHPTVKPLALMRYLIKLITPPNGIILDPFMGSGSTLVAAGQLGFKAIGIEIDEKYCETAQRRINGLFQL